ncbi:MAG: hypothetical protein ACT4QA_07805 [Panacagrimonas sp.]
MSPKSQTRAETKRSPLEWVAALVVLGGLIWLPHSSLLFVALCAGTHVEETDADLDHDGYVSVSEAGYACNVDSRSTTRDGHACTEYYNRRDWRTVKLVCEPA